MIKPRTQEAIGLVLIGATVAGVTIAAKPAPTAARLAFDFNSRTTTSVSQSHGVVASATVESVGTIDTYAGSPSDALRLVADFKQAKGHARATLAGGVGQIRNTEANLAKITVGFDLRVKQIQPVRVIVQSRNTAGQPTGSRYAVVQPPITNAYYRFNIDLDKTKPLTGKFDPKSPNIAFFFEINDNDGAVPRTVKSELYVDNVSYAAPTYYVRETGSDTADGRSESNAFATIQKAIDVAQPGDIILLMNGTYRNTNPYGIARIAKAGTPARWIVIRACPGQKPQVFNDGWEGFKLVPGSAYIELRGLTIRGNSSNVKLADALADGVIKTRNGAQYYGNPLFNGNGISIDGRGTELPNRPHHIRLIENRVYENCGAGLSSIASGYVTMEGNIVSENAHFMRYGGSGISYLEQGNFDTQTNHHDFIVGNRVYNNRCYVPWIVVEKMSDGNGIIIDTNIFPNTPEKNYTARTLIANNIVTGSGGGGITITTSQGVDIVHNTVYKNVQTPELAKENWGDIFVAGGGPGSREVTVLNNIVVAEPGHARFNAWNVADTLVRNNLFFGSDANRDVPGKSVFTNNSEADPRFVGASLEATVADFHLLPDSPAVGKAFSNPRLIPRYDFGLKARPIQGAAIGAYEVVKTPSRTVLKPQPVKRRNQ